MDAKADDLRSTIARLMPEARASLDRLVRIPSIAFPGYDPVPVRASAETTAQILERAGLRDVRLIEIDGGHPAVLGQTPAPSGAPTVLLYAHHDVQPEGPLEEWDSPPYEPQERDGRLYGRGTSDDKCGIVMHATAIRAFEGVPPVGVKVIVEGEEESTTEHLPFLIEGHRDLLGADVVVVADSGNWRRGVPTLTTTLRGVVDCVVEVRVLDKAVHSGSYGGPVPDALSALARLLATLHDDDGNVAISGLRREAWEGTEMSESELREEAGVRPGVRFIGSGTIGERLWNGPAVSVLGIDAPSVVEASNQLVPVARAKVSLRVAPDDDAEAALRALGRHLEAAAPWGVETRVELGKAGQGFRVSTEVPAYAVARRAMEEAWGRRVVLMGSGGSIPLVPLLSRTFPEAAILMLGASDELSAAHSVNESVDLEELERACLAEALLMIHLSGT
jgi:acetylornithine deacetylase/succinyl-diaminopimelate desuccinylase-like protein